MKVNSIKIKLKVSVIIDGLMARSMRVHGRTTRCMVEEYSHGPMEEDMKDSTSMIKNQDMGSIDGAMVVFTRENGKTASKTVLDHSEIAKEKRGRACGFMART